MTLSDFLRARIAEDDAAARAAVVFDYGVTDWCDDGDPVNLHIARHDPTHVLAECEARRRIVELAGRWRGDANDYGQLDTVLEHLALPYADHPDFDPGWVA